MSIRQAILAVTAVLALTLATGCSVQIGGADDDGTELFGEANSMQWDLTRPLKAEDLGLPGDQMVVVTVPDDATVGLVLPTGTWSGRTEEMTVTTRNGYVDQVDLFWTEADGQAAADRMVADASLLGMDPVRLAGWADRARRAETADTNRGRKKTNYNGASGEVSVSISPSMATGEGQGTPVRLWYKFYVRDVVETAT